MNIRSNLLSTTDNISNTQSTGTTTGSMLVGSETQTETPSSVSGQGASSAPKMPPAPVTVQQLALKLEASINNTRTLANNVGSQMMQELNSAMTEMSIQQALATIAEAKLQATAQIVTGSIGIAAGVIQVGFTAYSTRAGEQAELQKRNSLVAEDPALQDKKLSDLVAERKQLDKPPEIAVKPPEPEVVQPEAEMPKAEIPEAEIPNAERPEAEIPGAKGPEAEQADVKPADQPAAAPANAETSGLAKQKMDLDDRITQLRDIQLKSADAALKTQQMWNSYGEVTRTFLTSAGSIVSAKINQSAAGQGALKQMEQMTAQQLQSTMSVVQSIVETANGGLGQLVDQFSRDIADANSTRANIRV
ncbi:MAG: hypothetical protein RLZZ436_4219 [Planctomycetota bacterium]